MKQIHHPKGDIYHAVKASGEGFASFGEAYFSTIIKDETKGWKKHTRMVLNLVVPVGAITIVLHDDRVGSATCGEFFSVTLSQHNYQRLTVEPGIWMAFRGEHEGLNMMLNVASIEHDPDEAENVELETFPYNWSAL